MRIHLLLPALVALGAAACGTQVPRRLPEPLPLPADVSEPAPRTILLRGEQLALAKALVAQRDSLVMPVYRALLAAADSAMQAKPVSVTEKRLLPPSGDRHDFQSFAPYWWPDTTKPGGLPYVRRDGVVNPASRTDHDGWRMARMVGAVEALALAHYLTGEERYAARAAEHLRVFFLDPATRMTPHLQYAQAIPGVTPGRGIGILDSRHLVPLTDALALLKRSRAYTDADRAGIDGWMRTYLQWLLTSENGRDEADEPNNHGTFYDMQVLALALHVGDTAQARRTIAQSRERIDHHFEADGSQPLELRRTRPLHYSLFNLEAFTALAEMSRHTGDDLWRYVSPRGATLRKALAFLAPYADPAVKAPWNDVAPVDRGIWVLPLHRAALATGDSAFHAALRHLPAARWRIDRSLFGFIGIPLADVALERAGAQLRRLAVNLDPAKGFPRVTGPDGTYEQHPARQWTSGFFSGALWYMYQRTRDDEWRRLAERWTAGVEPVKTMRTTHDLGFMVFNSFGHGHLLTGNPHYRDVVMEASRSLATRFNPVVGAIQSWDTYGRGDARGSWKYPVIVDNLMNLEMLFWAAANGGDTTWASMAERHALTSARVHLRPDGSTAHVALFDPETGRLERTVTWQGLNDASAWARGQAWAIHGLAASYGRTRNASLLRDAERAADWFVANMPADAVPFWDFRHPDIPRVERDASAGAIAAAGLYDLARHSSPARAARYRAAADRIVTELAARYMAPPSAAGPVLLHSVGQRPQGVEIDVGIIYADYYFVEALLRQRGMFLE